MNNSNQTALAENITNIGQNFEPIWDSTEAARYLRIHPRTLTRMARRAEIPAIHIGKLWRFRKCDLEAWMKANSGPTLSSCPQPEIAAEQRREVSYANR